MRYSRSRRRRRARYLYGTVVVVVAAGAVSAWWYLRGRAQPPPVRPVVATPGPARAGPAPAAGGGPVRPAPARPARLAADEEVLVPAQPASRPADPIEAAFGRKPATQPGPAAPPADALAAQAPPEALQPPGPAGDPAGPRGGQPQAGSAALDAARRRIEQGQLIEARHELNALLGRNLSEAEVAEVQSLLTRVAEDTLFGKRIVPGDPLVESYTIQPGDRLIHIGRKYDVPAEALMMINGIADPRTIRAGERLKVVRGPFHARIYKSKFRLDLYLGELYVRSYRVGLGVSNGTPEGTWRVKERLSNPTYYPPASATDKRIIPADDPSNPLGEHWIGLEGIEGNAVGHTGYGIHGTIEPESVGKAVSLGCIRMHNEDVAQVYALLLPGRSTVTILP